MKNRFDFQCAVFALILFCSLTLFFSDAIAENGRGFKTASVALYQPDEQLRERVPNVKGLADYVKALQEVCSAHFAFVSTPGSLDIVVVVKPGNRSRIWFANSQPAMSSADIKLLTGKLSIVQPPSFRRGPVAFAIRGSIAGGTPVELGGMPLPIPTEWKESFAKNPQMMPIPDSPMDVLWPDPPGQENFDVPKGFTLQKLEATGGKIARPKGWYYNETATPTGYVWTISKEDSSKEPYLTGLRIQLIAGINETFKKSPQQLIKDIISERKSTAKIIDTCKEANKGMFKRICLETEEMIDNSKGNILYHILYSYFWSDRPDLVVLTVFGCPADEWQNVKDTVNIMSDFTLLDMSRFNKYEQK